MRTFRLFVAYICYRKILDEENIKTIRKEGHWEGEFNVKRKDRSTIPAFIINTILRSLDGKDIGILGVSTDITERKKAEQELIKSKEQALESEERFDLAMKATKDGLYDWNLTNNEINYSPSWKHMLGYENDELSNDLSTWEKLINPQDVKRVSLLNKKVMDKQLSNVEIEFKMKHKDGHWVDILSRAEAFYNDVGEANRIVGTHIDITERKLAEEKHRTILETAINGFWVVNMQGEFVEVNDAYCHMSGYSIDELLTMSISDIECIESPTDINNRINDILKNGSDHFETKHRRKGGSVYDVEINIQYKQFDEGQFVCFINDITERKQAEEKLKAKIGQLEMMNDIMVDRELNLNETRKEVNKLLAKLGEDEKYKTIG